VLRGLRGALAAGGTAPGLAAALARAARGPAPTAFGPLALSLFGMSADAPQAPYVRLAHGRAPDARWWLRAAPVSLVADLDRVHLSQPRDPALELDAARALAAPLAEHLAAIDVTLEVLSPREWSLGLTAPLAASTSEPEAAEHDMHAALPAGDAGSKLRALMTELQMLMHGHPINAERTGAGLPPLNGLWLWGGGAEANRPPRAPTRLVAEDPLLVGLARAAGLTPGRTILHEPGVVEVDLDSDAKRLRELDRETLAAAIDALDEGAIDALVVHPGNGASYRLTRLGRWRVWRRPIDLGELVTQGATTE
jgi:hypothetical protein